MAETLIPGSPESRAYWANVHIAGDRHPVLPASFGERRRVFTKLPGVGLVFQRGQTDRGDFE